MGYEAFSRSARGDRPGAHGSHVATRAQYLTRVIVPPRPTPVKCLTNRSRRLNPPLRTNETSQGFPP
ncbi:hypothetical protein GCM10028812_09500 [Ancylobacter sonchi]